MNDTDFVDEIKEIFDGQDPIAEGHGRMKKMDKDELIVLVLIAANRIGTIMKGREYEDSLDAAVHLSHGIEIIFSAYDSAMMNMDEKATTLGFGNA